MSGLPGPWEAERFITKGDLPHPWVGRLAEHRYSALACGETAEEALANACLIASAPETYSLLKLLEWGDEDRPGCPFCGMGKDGGHLDRCQLDAALAKAEGRP